MKFKLNMGWNIFFLNFLIGYLSSVKGISMRNIVKINNNQEEQ